MAKNNLGPNPDREENVTKFSSASKVLFLLIIAVAGGAIYFWLTGNDNPVAFTDTVPAEEPTFIQEGELVFLDENSEDTLAQIAIEVADDDAQRTQGLMYRSSLPDSGGMLFIFDQASPRSFWMKNTKIPLDILYVDETKRIFMIYKSVMPYSERSIPSQEAALYVVEVNSGFTTRNQIEEGDQISFVLN